MDPTNDAYATIIERMGYDSRVTDAIRAKSCSFHDELQRSNNWGQLLLGYGITGLAHRRVLETISQEGSERIVQVSRMKPGRLSDLVKKHAPRTCDSASIYIGGDKRAFPIHLPRELKGILR
jgi:hypothetical protein